MRSLRTAFTALICTTVLAGLTGFAGAGTAAAESPSPDAGENTSGPTQAGTGFRDATAVPPGSAATAEASSGDYLYWAFPVDAGQRPTFKAEVTLPQATARHGDSTWRIDVYDGLRRRQPCMYGMQSRAAGQDTGSVALSCTLRPVRSLADPWSDHPLPGSYYLRLTVTDAPEKDLGLPVRARVEADLKDAGGAEAVDGTLSTPLVPGASAKDAEDAEDGGDGKDDESGQDGKAAEEEGGDDASPGPSTTRQTASSVEPEDGWSSGWWSDRWIWTAAGGVLAVLAAFGGRALTRRPQRPSRVPPGY